LNKISIIIPIYNEEKYIENCLDSILQSDYTQENIEVLLIDGMSCDLTRDKISPYLEKYSFIRLIDNQKKIAPVAMNIGIENSTGKFIFVISAHAKYDQDYFWKLVKQCQVLKADCTGPSLLTSVKNSNSTSNAIRNVLSDKLGVGGGFRSGVSDIKEVDTVPFGCYRRDIFEKIGLYDERLIRNQDIELNKRIKNSGGKIFIIPEVTCTYFARESFKELAKNNFNNGLWNILTAYNTKTLSSLSLKHFVPFLFVMFLILTLLLSFYSTMFFYIFTTILFFYSLIIVFRSFQIKKQTTFLHQFFAFVILHFSYGVGSFIGMIKVLKNMF
jgi:glycosyltransferase involved in cell wall biosynthesis